MSYQSEIFLLFLKFTKLNNFFSPYIFTALLIALVFISDSLHLNPFRMQDLLFQPSASSLPSSAFSLFFFAHRYWIANLITAPTSSSVSSEIPTKSLLSCLGSCTSYYLFPFPRESFQPCTHIVKALILSQVGDSQQQGFSEFVSSQNLQYWRLIITRASHGESQWVEPLHGNL